MSKVKGMSAELLFRSECLKRNIIPSIPDADNSSYDAIIECSDKLLKIQIKATNSKEGHGYRISCSHGTGIKRRYSKSDVDYFAFYIIERNVWFFVPLNKIKTNNINLYPDKLDHRFSPYQNAWHIFFSE
tara:strand:- start:181 stop:570 length:390 start_codon:yes stop_codon:yes gene_type:complete